MWWSYASHCHWALTIWSGCHFLRKSVTPQEMSRTPTVQLRYLLQDAKLVPATKLYEWGYILSTLSASEHSHLHHVDEVIEVLLLVNCQLGFLVDDMVMKDLLLKAYTQNVVTGVPNRLAHQKQAVLHWLQFADSLRTWDLPMEPSGMSITSEKWYILLYKIIYWDTLKLLRVSVSSSSLKDSSGVALGSIYNSKRVGFSFRKWIHFQVEHLYKDLTISCSKTTWEMFFIVQV